MEKRPDAPTDHEDISAVLPENNEKKKLSSKERKALMKLYRRGMISDDYLSRYEIDKNRYPFLYSQFRRGGLSRFDSFYNAMFLCVLRRFDLSEKKVASELRGTYSHPKGWYKDSFYTWKNNIWSVLLHLLQLIPRGLSAIGAFFRHLPENLSRAHRQATVSMDNSFRRFVGFSRLIRRGIGILLPLALALGAGFFIHGTLNETTALDLLVGGEYVGTVENSETVLQAKTDLEHNIRLLDGRPYVFTDDISYHFTHGRNLKYLEYADVYSLLYNVAKGEIRPAYGLFVDDVLIAATENRHALERAQSDILDYYKERYNFYNEDTDTPVRIDYANNIRIVEGDYLVSSLVSENGLRERLGLEPLENENDFSLYAVYYRTIKQSFGKTLNEDLSGVTATLNSPDEPDVEAAVMTGTSLPADIHLNYMVTREETEKETIPFETVIEETDEYLVGQESIVSRGTDGSRLATYQVSYVDGEEVSREFVSEEILVPAVDRVVRVGTRAPTAEEAETLATGSFIMPFNNYLSASYGIREIEATGERDFHNAWDIPGKYGADIVAADGGVVTGISFSDGYGIHVTIDHENGFETVYAHLSDTYVEIGQRVSQGEVIAAMGATGKITGVHVHFEIRKNGVSVDPEQYLGYVEERY